MQICLPLNVHSRIVALSFSRDRLNTSMRKCTHDDLYRRIWYIEPVWEPGVPETNLCTLYQRGSLGGIVVTTSQK